jgi:hypothetical protein
MPTIQLAKLQQEAALLSDRFVDSESYLAGVLDLLQTYAVPVHRQGRVKGLRPVLRTYEVPPPLIKQLQLEMTQQARLFPTEAMQIADGLWVHRSIETRTLAARLLGVIEAEPLPVAERLAAWAHENREPVLAPELSQHAALRLAAANPQQLIVFAAEWLATKEPRMQTLALGTMQTLLSETDFANLPALFAVLAPVAADPDRSLRPDLADLLAALAKRSPKETEFFLTESLASDNDGAGWVARQVMKVLPEESRERLRAAMQPR